ncbi:MAG: GNAT family N-acetyltransferase [Clostridiaceae bacterium]|nr:GNAT family N-acetyltransferase [Clostridiaceae bacterium]
MDIRTAGINDIEAIRIFYEDFFAHNASQQPEYYKKANSYPDYPISVVRSNDADILAAEENGCLIGFVHVEMGQTPPYETFVPHKFASVIDLYVEPSSRGIGAGSMLLSSAAKWAKTRGADYIELNVLTENENALRLYEKLGYKIVSHIMRSKI